MADIPMLQQLQGYLQLTNQRQEMIVSNMANVDTPGYQAQTVTFEAALQNAQQPAGQAASTLPMALTKPAHLVGVTDPQREPVGVSLRQGGTERADGNNVDIDVELTQMAETGIRYQAMSQLITKKYQDLTSLIK